MKAFLRRYRQPLQVVVIYIREAHASDTWPMKVHGEQPSPRSLEERLEYARACAAELAFPASFLIRVDDMADSFNAAFGAWPTCYYVVGEDKRLKYVGEVPIGSESDSYDVSELFGVLNSLP